MGPRFQNLDQDTPLLLPLNLRDWLPADHLAHFVLDAVETLNLRGPGDEQFPPLVMLALLIYGYAPGTFSRRPSNRSRMTACPGRWSRQPARWRGSC